jgi:hypothetical protein
VLCRSIRIGDRKTGGLATIIWHSTAAVQLLQSSPSSAPEEEISAYKHRCIVLQLLPNKFSFSILSVNCGRIESHETKDRPAWIQGKSSRDQWESAYQIPSSTIRHRVIDEENRFLTNVMTINRICCRETGKVET